MAPTLVLVGGVITGDIRVNGHPKEERTFARVMGYCEQTDIHVAYATVHEALQFRQGHS